MPYKKKEDRAKHHLLYMRKWRHSPESRSKHLALIKRKYNKNKKNGKLKKYRLKLKLQVIQAYGGKCTCSGCPETDHEFLCLDHINGGGNKHRREVLKNKSHGHALYSWLIKNNFPNIFRLLCANCNQAIGLYGYCPHEKLLAGIAILRKNC